MVGVLERLEWLLSAVLTLLALLRGRPKTEEKRVRRSQENVRYYVSEFGECYHAHAECEGLRRARAVRALRLCKYCRAKVEGRREG